MLTYLEDIGHIQESINDRSSAPIDKAIFQNQGEAVLLLMQMGYRAYSIESIERFVNEEPSDTQIKNKINEILVERRNDN